MSGRFPLLADEHVPRGDAAAKEMLKPRRGDIDSLYGCLKDLPGDPLADLEAEHRAELEAEERWRLGHRLGR